MLTLRHLRYLAAVAETRHFGRAAQMCHVTQPALSMQIQDLERELGLQLVERRPGSIDLTPDGREVARRAASIMASVADLSAYAKGVQPALVGPLRLGIIPSIAPYLLPQILPELQRAYPGLEMRVRETQTRTLAEELLRGELDLILIALPHDHPELDTLEVFEDRFLVARQARRGAKKRERFSAEDLATQRLLLLEEGHCLRDQALSFCGLVRSDVHDAFGASSLSTVMHLVANGYGITLLPEMAAQVEAIDRRVQLVPFGEPEPKRLVGLAWRRSSARRADAEALAELIKETRTAA